MTPFSPDTIAWFEVLEQENTRAFFHATRDQYERAVRGALQELLASLASEFGGTVKLFRQNRDVRFSNDKSPYKTATAGLIHSRSASNAPLYAEISARGLYVGSGYHELARDQLHRYRHAAAGAEGDALRAILDQLTAAGLALMEPALKTAPRGFPRDHRNVDLLRYKSVVAGRRFGAPEIYGRSIAESVAATFRLIAPLNAWLDRAVGESTEPAADGRRG